MKTLKSRHLLFLILIGGVLFLSGCSPCDDGGGGQLSSAWTGLQFPVVEGGDVCACGKYSSCDEYFEVAHKTDSPLDLVDKYSEKLKSSGWQVEPSRTSRMSLWATKGDVKVDLFFTECTKTLPRPGTWSNCYSMSATKKK